MTAALPRAWLAAAKILVILLVVGAVAWDANIFSPFWYQAVLPRVARHVIAGDPYKTDTLVALLPSVRAVEEADDCHPSAVRDAAIIRLRLAEDAIAAGEQDQVGDYLSSLRASIRRSLSCSPADSFLWLVLFWVDNTMDGFSADHLNYLRESYRLGPNEGWIALKRNRLALAVFEQLSPDIAKMALTEFARLLDSGFVRETVAIMEGPGWRIRALLLDRLTNVSEIPRGAFARALYRDGYDVNVPGIKQYEPRPWH